MKLVLPREHGAWGMLYTPLAMAAATLGLGPRGLLLGLAATFLYLAHEPLDRLVNYRTANGHRPASGVQGQEMRRWLLLYLGLGLLAALALLAGPGAAALLGVGLATLAVLGVVMWLSGHGHRYSLWTRVLAAAGLSLGAPAYAAAQVGEIPRAAWMVALYSFFFFMGSIYRVRVHIRAQGKEEFRATSLWGHVGILTAAAATAALRWAPAPAPLSLLPGLLQALVLWRRGPDALVPKALGMRELRLNLAFFGILAAAYRLG